jgi:AcrR family transcriptional regulator
MPRLWNDTIAAHRDDVRRAVIEATAALIAEHGLLSVTMSSVAEASGIGRATLYKYFPDVESILVAWHEQQMATHLAQLDEASRRPGSASNRLEAVLETFAFAMREAVGHFNSDIARTMHRHEQVAESSHQLMDLLRSTIDAAVAEGSVRGDVPPDELARFAAHSLTAASGLPSKAAVRRLVALTLAGIAASPATDR